VAENPSNAPAVNYFAGSGDTLPPGHLALLTGRYWGVGGVKLSVQFLDVESSDLKKRILAHANVWGESANIVFALTGGIGDVRVATRPGDGYWSYLGTDIRHIAPQMPTMNLDSFSMQTPESEFLRVPPHEFGHSCGFPHEHMRSGLVRRLDPQKTIAYFLLTQGWSPQMTEQQVLTPIPESDLQSATPVDQVSIMCYSLPAEITIDGLPIVGGSAIDSTDRAVAAQYYPKAPVAAAPVPPAQPGWTITISGTGPKPSVSSV
jgi:hypothetical protein